MGYNLNFFPNNYNQSSLSNSYNPYSSPYDINNNNMQNIQKNLEDRLGHIQQLQNQFSQPNAQMNMQPNNQQINNKPYYLFCGNKSDWDEFLLLNYGITEKAIFDDYKLFLEAKQEILEEQGQNKKDVMKNKIRNNNTKNTVDIDGTVRSNIKPNKQSPEQQPIVNGNVAFNGECNRVNMGDSIEHNNGLLEQDKTQLKNNNRKK